MEPKDLFSSFGQNPLLLGGLMGLERSIRGDDAGTGMQAGFEAANSQQRMQMTRQRQKQEAAQAQQAQAAQAERQKQFAQMTGQPIPGVSPEQMKVLQFLGPEKGGALLSRLIQDGNDPMRAAELEYKRAQIKKLNAEAAGGGDIGNDYGLTPIYGRDAQGNPILLQPSKRGTAVQTALPDGVTLDLEARARSNAVGKGQGEAQVDLAPMERNAKQIISQIDALLSDPKLPGMTGYSAYLPNVSPQSQGTQSRMDQVTGKAFVQAFQEMKGAGAITELEGAKAAAALTRLQNPYQSPDDYKAALNEFKQEVISMVEAARRKANVSVPGQPSQQGGWSIQRVP